MTQYLKFNGAVYRLAEEDTARDPYTVHKDGRQSGLRCVVLSAKSGSRLGNNINGYVGVPKTHPLAGKHYMDKVPDLIHDKNTYGEPYTDEERRAVELDHVLRLPGVPVSYSEQGDDLYPVPAPDLWWFGFFIPSHGKVTSTDILDTWGVCGMLAKQLVDYQSAAKFA